MLKKKDYYSYPNPAPSYPEMANILFRQLLILARKRVLQSKRILARFLRRPLIDGFSYYVDGDHLNKNAKTLIELIEYQIQIEDQTAETHKIFSFKTIYSVLLKQKPKAKEWQIELDQIFELHTDWLEKHGYTIENHIFYSL